MYANGRRLRTIFMFKNFFFIGVQNFFFIGVQFVDMNYFSKNSCQQQEYPVLGSWRDMALLTTIIMDISQGRR